MKTGEAVEEDATKNGLNGYPCPRACKTQDVGVHELADDTGYLLIVHSAIGDRWSEALLRAWFVSAIHRYPRCQGGTGEVGYYFLQIPLPRRSRWSCLADEWSRYPRDHWLVMPSLSWIIDQWTVSPAAKHSDATYTPLATQPQPPFFTAATLANRSSFPEWEHSTRTIKFSGYKNLCTNRPIPYICP